MSEAHLLLEPPSASEGKVTLGAILRRQGQPEFQLWFRVAEQHASLLTHSVEPFLLASLMPVMQDGGKFHVQGEVSSELLGNLQEFQQAWTCWKPELFKPVQILPETVRPQAPTLGGEALMGFSGGADSAFAAFRISRGESDSRREVKAGLMVHGFDVKLEQHDVFERAAERSRRMLAAAGLETLTVETNCRSIFRNWEALHGSALAAALMLFSGRFRAAEIASTYNYATFEPGWGSNPITDPLLSSASFRFFHMDAAFSKLRKLEALAKWKPALDDLRVCWEGAENDRNCGHCFKCILTLLAFRVFGADNPGAFPEGPSEADIAALNLAPRRRFAIMNELVTGARQRGVRDRSIIALGRAVRRQKRENALLRPPLPAWLRNRLRGRIPNLPL